jgi:hypothetical protein
MRDGPRRTGRSSRHSMHYLALLPVVREPRGFADRVVPKHEISRPPHHHWAPASPTRRLPGSATPCLWRRGLAYGAVALASPQASQAADRHLPVEMVPSDTDSQISCVPAFGGHLVWPVDRSRPGSVDKALLYLFLPSIAAQSIDYTRIQQEAVDPGYHVIGLAYPNSAAVVPPGICVGALLVRCNPANASRSTTRAIPSALTQRGVLGGDSSAGSISE